jgi:diguanylate cyclase (GGDEF)-like protein
LPPAADPADRLQACLAAADPARVVQPGAGCEAARAAMALAAQLGRTSDEALAGAWLCTLLLRRGRYAELLVQAKTVLPLLAAAPVADTLAADRRELLRVVTLAGCETGAFDVALDAAHELVRLTADLGEGGPHLSAAFALAVCFERMGDSWQAIRLLQQTLHTVHASVPASLRLRAFNGLCAISIGVYHRLVGAVPDGEARAALDAGYVAGLQARDLMPQVVDPVSEVAILGNLGEVQLYRGECVESDALLRVSLDLARMRGLIAHGWRIQASIGGWLVAAGQPAAALAAMRDLLHTMGDDAPQQTAVRANHVAYLACRALAQPAEALAYFEQVERLERSRAITQLRAQSALFVTRAEAQHAQWQAEQARLDARLQRDRATEYAASAERDPLTGLGNRRHLDRRCAELLPAARQASQPLALALLDIDHFKVINDRYGHAVGDRVLVMLAQLLRENMRTGDVLVRYGGEEFVIVLPGMSPDLAAEVCERLRERVAVYPWAGLCGAGAALTLSIGLSGAPPHDLQALLLSADQALYQAKHGGRNRLCIGLA